MSFGNLFDFAVITIFAREVLEGAIIIGEYRTIILRLDNWPEGSSGQQAALRAVTLSALFATLLAILVCAAIAIPLAIFSSSFDNRTSKVVEGISKIVAAVCLVQISLKIPKWLGIYESKKRLNSTSSSSAAERSIDGLSLNSIRFNVAWNIWREVAECGVFLIPFFLSGDVKAIPLSAVAGVVVGLLLGLGIYYANKTFTNKFWLASFVACLLAVTSAGLFCGGSHNLEAVFGETPKVWSLTGDLWSVDRLPMTVLKPFGYSDSRTVLQIVTYWSWLILCALLHARKWKQTQTIRRKLRDYQPGERSSTAGNSHSSQDGDSRDADSSNDKSETNHDEPHEQMEEGLGTPTDQSENEESPSS